MCDIILSETDIRLSTAKISEQRIKMKIDYILKRKRLAGKEVTTHKHSGYEIIYYIQGKGKLIIEDNSFDYFPGSYCIIDKEAWHSEAAAEDTDLIFVVFEHPGDIITVNGESQSIKSICNIVYADSTESPIKFSDMLDTIMTEFYSDNCASLAISEHLTEVLLLFTLRHTTANINIISTKQSSLESAYRQIIDYFNSDIDCSKIAKSIGYSYDRFRHLFKERFGLSVKQMIIAKRMDNAKILLCTTDLTVSEIASACGYKNVTQFCSTFRKTQGMAPIEYRRFHVKKQLHQQADL